MKNDIAIGKTVNTIKARMSKIRLKLNILLEAFDDKDAFTFLGNSLK